MKPECANAIVVAADADALAWVDRAVDLCNLRIARSAVPDLEQFAREANDSFDVAIVVESASVLAVQALSALRTVGLDLPCIAVTQAKTVEGKAMMLSAGAAACINREEPALLGPIVRREARLLRERREFRRLVDESLDSGEGRPAELRRETQLNCAHAALLKMARSRRFSGENLIDDLREITEIAGHALNVSRASVWLYDPRQTKIRCIDLFDMQTNKHTDGAELLYEDHPAYFLALEERRLIVAHDARSDPATREYLETYLEPNKIVSMLDAAARLRGELVGVICLEQTMTLRHWTIEEEVFACALADLVSLALEASERHVVEAQLLDSERKFREIFTHTKDLVVLAGVRGRGRFVCEGINPAAERATGLVEREILERTPHDFLPVAMANSICEKLRECMERGGNLRFETNVRTLDGERRFDAALIPIRDVSGRVYRIAAIARDVSPEAQAGDSAIFTMPMA